MSGERWWGSCEGCGRKVGFLAYKPGTTIKVCADCYERSRPRAPRTRPHTGSPARRRDPNPVVTQPKGTPMIRAP